MKKTEQGFGILEAVIIVMIVALLLLAGWFVLNKQKSDTDSQTGSTNNNVTQTDPTTIYDVDITLQTEADLDKLPDYTPASFKTYLAEILRNNSYAYNENEGVDTIVEYRISKISQVNIAGGRAVVDKDGNGYPGGAPVIWVLTPSGAWDEESLNGPVCTSKNGGKIYEEFAAECYTEYGATDQSSWGKNPHGSITSLGN